MILRLVNDKRYTEPFIRFLTKAVKQEIIAEEDVRKLAPFGEMLVKLEIKTTPIIVVNEGIASIKYRKVSDVEEEGFEIYLDEEVRLSGTKYKLIDLIKLLENGNTELVGYPLFTDAFKKIKKDINNQYRLYELGFGLIYGNIPL